MSAPPQVLTLECANHIAEQHLDLNRRAHDTQRLTVEVGAEANTIGSKANVIAEKTFEGVQDERQREAVERVLLETQEALADSFYAGLMVVLVTTLTGGWQRATSAVAAVVGVCPAPASVPASWRGLAWLYVGGGPGPLDYAWCVTKSLVGAAWGALLLLLLGWKLLQYSVVTRFQSAPATVLLVVLGGGCGVVGRSAVNSLGGDGQLWQQLWCTYVATAAAATWRAAWVSGMLSRMGPLGRMAFHITLGAAVPFAVGAAPFEDVFAAIAREAGQR